MAFGRQVARIATPAERRLELLPRASLGHDVRTAGAGGAAGADRHSEAQANFCSDKTAGAVRYRSHVGDLRDLSAAQLAADPNYRAQDLTPVIEYRGCRSFAVVT